MQGSTDEGTGAYTISYVRIAEEEVPISRNWMGCVIGSLECVSYEARLTR